MIVLGIDPGIEKTGLGIIEQNSNDMRLIAKELIQTSSKLKHQERLGIIFETLNTILSLYNIDCASVEKLFFAKNTKTAMTVSEARGVILLALHLKNIPIFEYTPLQVKQSLIGYGRGEKSQVQALVKMLLKLENVPKPDDVADAIALAITHINTHKFLSKISKS